VTGKLGVMQGNISDLKMGLPLQSVMKKEDEFYHEPLRLLTIVQAPRKRVEKIIQENQGIKNLLNNSWIALTVIEPSTNIFYRYHPESKWQEESSL